VIRLTAVAAAFLCWGCAATAPLLAEPRLVREGDVRFQVGAAGVAPIGGDLAAVKGGRDRLDQGPVASDDPATTQVVLPAVAAGFSSRPGVAPVARATLSLSEKIEGSVHYSGRDAHVGGRYLLWESRSVDAGAVTFSVGLDGHAVLQGRPPDGYLNATSETVRGWGGAAPFILGWQSDGNLLIAYVGALVGYERVSAKILFGEPGRVTAERDMVLGRFHLTGTAGFGVGFRRVRAIVELGVRRDQIDARIGDQSKTVMILSLTPGFAFGINF
jgi:hypothetical protein